MNPTSFQSVFSKKKHISQSTTNMFSIRYVGIIKYRITIKIMKTEFRETKINKEKENINTKLHKTRFLFNG
jgi:hypothetical protein